MTEFKVGDRVRLLKDLSPHAEGDIGQIVEVRQTVGVFPYLVKFPEHDSIGCPLYADEIELSAPPPVEKEIFSKVCTQKILGTYLDF